MKGRYKMKKQYRTIDDILKDFKTDDKGRTLWNVSNDTNHDEWIVLELESKDEKNSDK